MNRSALTLIGACVPVVLLLGGCIAPHWSSPAGRDSDGRTIGADVGAAKGNATTQPVSGEGAVGQVGGVNSALTYVSGFGLGVVSVLIAYSWIGHRTALSDNTTQQHTTTALKDVAVAAINKGTS